MTNTPPDGPDQPREPAVPGDPEQPSIPDATPAAPGYQAPGLADPAHAAPYPPPAAPAAPYGAPAAPAAPYGAPGYAAYPPQPPVNALSIVALVLSLISISIGGVICGHIALSQIRRTGERGHGMALAGLIVGYVGCAAWILLWVIWLVLVLSLTALPHTLTVH